MQPDEAVSSSRNESEPQLLTEFLKAVNAEYTQQNRSQTPVPVSEEAIALLCKLLKRLHNIEIKRTSAKQFTEGVLDFIDMMVVFLSNQKKIDYVQETKYINLILGSFKTKYLKNAFVVEGTARILEMFMYNNLSDAGKKILLKIFNKIDTGVNEQLRTETAEGLLSYMFNIIDSLRNYGDYTLQTDIMEAIYRIFGYYIKKLPDEDFEKYMIEPNSRELGVSLKDIDNSNFENRIRIWLNNYNTRSSNIFSILCQSVTIGSIHCDPTDEAFDGKSIWVDFNIKDGNLGFFVSDELGWGRLTLLAKYVTNVQIKRPAENRGTTVILSMNFKKSIICDTAKESIWKSADKHLQLTICKEDNEKQLNRLISHVLPKMFKDTFIHTSNRISEQTKAVYKPLRIKISRNRAVPSDVSSILTTSDAGSISDDRPPSERPLSVMTTRDVEQTPSEYASSLSSNHVLQHQFASTKPFRSVDSIALSDFTRYSTTRTDSVGGNSPVPSNYLDDDVLSPDILSDDYNVDGVRDIVQDNIVTSSLNILDLEDPKPEMSSGVFYSSPPILPSSPKSLSDDFRFCRSEMFTSSPVKRSRYFARELPLIDTSKINQHPDPIGADVQDAIDFETVHNNNENMALANNSTQENVVNVLNTEEADEVIRNMAIRKQTLLQGKFQYNSASQKDILGDQTAQNSKETQSSSFFETEQISRSMSQNDTNIEKSKSKDKQDAKSACNEQQPELKQLSVVVSKQVTSKREIKLQKELEPQQISNNTDMINKSAQELRERVPELPLNTSQSGIQINEVDNFSLAVNVGLPDTQYSEKPSTEQTVSKKGELMEPAVIDLSKTDDEDENTSADRDNNNVKTVPAKKPRPEEKKSEQPVDEAMMNTAELLTVLNNSQSQGVGEQSTDESVYEAPTKISTAVVKEVPIKKTKRNTKVKAKDNDTSFRISSKIKETDRNIFDYILDTVHYVPQVPRSAKQNAAGKISNCLQLESIDDPRNDIHFLKKNDKEEIGKNQQKSDSKNATKDLISTEARFNKGFLNNPRRSRGKSSLKQNKENDRPTSLQKTKRNITIEEDELDDAENKTKLSKFVNTWGIPDDVMDDSPSVKEKAQDRVASSPDKKSIASSNIALNQKTDQTGPNDIILQESVSTAFVVSAQIHHPKEHEDPKNVLNTPTETAVRQVSPDQVQEIQEFQQQLDVINVYREKDVRTCKKAKRMQAGDRGKTTNTIVKTSSHLEQAVGREKSIETDAAIEKNYEQQDFSYSENTVDLSKRSPRPVNEAAADQCKGSQIVNEGEKSTHIFGDTLRQREKELEAEKDSVQTAAALIEERPQQEFPYLDNKVDSSDPVPSQVTTVKGLHKKKPQINIHEILIFPPKAELEASTKTKLANTGNPTKNQEKKKRGIFEDISLKLEQEINKVVEKKSDKRKNFSDLEISLDMNELKPSEKKDKKKVGKSKKPTACNRTIKKQPILERNQKDKPESEKQKSLVDFLLEDEEHFERKSTSDDLFSKRIETSKPLNFSHPDIFDPTNAEDSNLNTLTDRPECLLSNKEHIEDPNERLTPEPVAISTALDHSLSKSKSKGDVEDHLRSEEKKSFTQLYNETIRNKDQSNGGGSRKKRKLYRPGSFSLLDQTIGLLGASTPPEDLDDLPSKTTSVTTKKRRSDKMVEKTANKLTNTRKYSKPNTRKKLKTGEDRMHVNELTNIFNSGLDRDPLKFKCPHCRKCIQFSATRPLSPWISDVNCCPPITPTSDDDNLDIVDSYMQDTVPKPSKTQSSNKINILGHVRVLPGNSTIVEFPNAMGNVSSAANQVPAVSGPPESLANSVNLTVPDEGASVQWVLQQTRSFFQKLEETLLVRSRQEY
ncbi:uncharacterized protein LOC126738777 isoform X2 [Anthonomus grandis grandis]|uniref:uncharacterized protein LOC126738777 isoform X2 n=1 Tax=Anthonomus grandis grandis TaxID=2921223 RepID=UPI0021664C90|nr:uncharacterized protein LOC126738777 isoform X2 [Anthonomus grandis grandis]